MATGTKTLAEEIAADIAHKRRKLDKPAAAKIDNTDALLRLLSELVGPALDAAIRVRARFMLTSAVGDIMTVNEQHATIVVGGTYIWDMPATEADADRVELVKLLVRDAVFVDRFREAYWQRTKLLLSHRRASDGDVDSPHWNDVRVFSVA